MAAAAGRLGWAPSLTDSLERPTPGIWRSWSIRGARPAADIGYGGLRNGRLPLLPPPPDAGRVRDRGPGFYPLLFTPVPSRRPPTVFPRHCSQPPHILGGAGAFYSFNFDVA